jgi:hypothetical protein
MAALATQVITGAGLGPTYAAAAGGGDTCNPGSGSSFLHVKNGSGAPITVTVDDVLTPIPAGSAANPDTVVSVPAGGERMIALDPLRHTQPATGLANITYSGVTSLTIACIQGPGR